MDYHIYKQKIIDHYSTIWNNAPIIKYFGKGPIEVLPRGFCVLEFPPTVEQNLWTYATCCMSKIEDINPIELFLFSPKQNPEPIELLTVITNYHVTGSKLNLHHTVNFGKPWIDDSVCTYGFISLAYVGGGERLNSLIIEGKNVHFYWLIPITKNELNFKIENGVDALEDQFEAAQFNYSDIHRKGVV